MNALNAIARHGRMLLICHAIRHLLDHAPEHTTLGDVEAIDLLQAAINSTDCHYTPDSLPQSPAFLPESAPQAPVAVAESDLDVSLVGEISVDRASLARVLHENPISLNSVLEALLHALDDEPRHADALPETDDVLDYVH